MESHNSTDSELLVAKRRLRHRPTHRWTDLETRHLIRGIRDELRDYPGSFGKPVSRAFYLKIAERAPKVAPIHWSIMRAKMRYMKKLYYDAREWLETTGNKLEDDDGVREYLERHCPHFYVLSEIFEGKTNKNPDTTTQYVESSSSNSEEEEEEDEEGSEKDTKPTIEFSHSDPLLPATHGLTQNSEITQTSNNLRQLAKKRKTRYDQEEQFNMEEQQFDLEFEKFEWQKEKEKKEFELKRLELTQQMELRKMEIERDERLAMAKMRLEHEREEALRKYEIVMKYKHEARK